MPYSPPEQPIQPPPGTAGTSPQPGYQQQFEPDSAVTDVDPTSSQPSSVEATGEAPGTGGAAADGALSVTIAVEPLGFDAETVALNLKEAPASFEFADPDPDPDGTGITFESTPSWISRAFLPRTFIDLEQSILVEYVCPSADADVPSDEVLDLELSVTT